MHLKVGHVYKHDVRIIEYDYTELLRSDIDSDVVACILRHLDDIAEGRTPPGPGAVGDNFGRVGDERCAVCVELACLVRRTVVVRVADR